MFCETVGREPRGGRGGVLRCLDERFDVSFPPLLSELPDDGL